MHVVHLAEALDPTRFRTRLITGRITEDEGDMTYYARERGVEVTEIAGMSRSLSPLRDLRSFLTLLRIFRRERPKIVHAQAREMAEGLRVAPMDRFAVIPLGLNLQPFADVDRAAARSRLRAELGIGEDSPVVGIVGRMVPVKNHPLLFDAMARLKGRMDPAPHLIVVGSGERERALRAYVSDKGLDGVVHWLGWRKDLPQVFPAFDVTALTSFDEGTPVSLIESLASGTPVVSLAVGGVPEILEGGELGRLVESASDNEVADALESVLVSPPSTQDAERGRRLVLERFSIRRLAEDVERLYTDALRRAGVGI